MNDLLVTKFSIPPVRASLVPRPHLVRRLNDALQPGQKLVLVSAPAGYGKTTLVAEWLQGLPSRSAWLSLDEADNDPRRFLAYLIAALEEAAGQRLDDTQGLLRAPQPLPPEVVLTALINELVALPQAMVLVLDDYHTIHNPAIHHFLAFLLERQPAHLHLALTTREDPLLPVSRLRAREQVVEIRQEHLRFSLEECAEFLPRVTGIHLTDEDIAALERRTEGWVAGLQMAALSMRGRSDPAEFIRLFDGSSRFILDYLVEEVFEHQTAEVKDFLLRTCILERLSAPLCNAVAEITSSQDLLERLEQANLFILPLDQECHWYRYHHLFSELLRHRLRRAGHPVEAMLHQRASQWYEAEGYLAEATHHALEAKNWDRSAALIGQAGDALLRRGELITLTGWCERLPGRIVDSQPGLGLSYAWALAMLGQHEKADGLLAKLEQMAESASPLMGQVAAAQAYVARGKGDNPRAIEKSQLALELLPPDSAQMRGLLALNLGLVYWHEGHLKEATQVLGEVAEVAGKTGNYYALFTARIFQARALVSQGALRQAEKLYLSILQDGGQVPILALAYYDLCGLYYEWDDLAKAGEHLEKGLALAVRSGNVEFQNSGHCLKALLLLAEGKPDEGLAEVEISHTLARDFNPATQARSAACHAQLALALGDAETAAHWVAQMAVDVDAHPFYRFIGLIRPRLMIARKEKASARELLKACQAKATQAGWGYALVAIHALLALAAEERGAALYALEEALKLGQAEGYRRTFIDTGSRLAPLLQEVARRGILPEYARQLLKAMGQGLKMIGSAILLEPLSARELEVLRLVAAGHSNREIARKLVISPGTAKTHVHNICGKLEVRNRTEATARAKELGLV